MTSLRLATWPVLLLGTSLLAQQSFDVASIKENREPGSGGSAQFTPDGGIRARHVSPAFLIAAAYGLESYQLRGAPDWATTTFYDVQAKSLEGGTREKLRERLQALLSERFALRVHREAATLDGFRLLRVRSDRLGPGLSPSSIDCVRAFSDYPECRDGHVTAVSVRMRGRPLQTLLQTLTGRLQAPVEDATGLAGNYDIELEWSAENGPTDLAPVLPTALQEQLGLKLESTRLRVELLVVDHIERPSPD